MYSQCQNYRTEPGVKKYGKIPYLVLLRVPIPRGVGKFIYRTGIRSIIKFPRSIIKFPRSIIKLLLAPFYNFWH